MDAPATPAATMDSDIENNNAGPVNVTPSKKSTNLRYAGLDSKLFTSLSQSSPTQARKALEAHIADADRRIREASKLGTSLLEQKKQLADRLKDVEKQTSSSDEIGPELKQKLADLEKEYNDLGRESARAFLSKSRKHGGSEDSQPLSKLSLDRPPSPSKSSMLPHTPLSRKQRNTSNRSDDLAFATEISTSLLGQLRHLQNVLAEKDEALRASNASNARLTADAENVSFKLRSMDENEQRYKDENWNLETQVQDLVTQLKEVSAREQKLTNSLKAANDDKSSTERECDELRLAHNKLTEDHTALRKKYDTETSSLRRNITTAENEKLGLTKKIEDLTTQNEDLAKAVAYRVTQDTQIHDRDIAFDSASVDLDNISDDGSPPPSPTKMGARHGVLESETLKSSLHHAHRMIQNLKNNIHREKTEKVELRRLLQDARDELEARRADSSAPQANASRRRKPNSQPDLLSKSTGLDKLGAAKTSQEEIINDPNWEEYDDSPTRPRTTIVKRDSAMLSTDQSDGFETANERSSNAMETDTFETASERESNATETEAFETAESAAGGDDSEGELTETETSTTGRQVSASLRDRSAGVRSSFQSTASDDADMYNFESASFSNEPPRYKLRLNRGGFRKGSETPSARNSPASFVSSQSTPTAHQDLAAELEELGDQNSVASSTPSRSLGTMTPAPELERKRDTVVNVPLPQPPVMIHSGTMTDASKLETIAPMASINHRDFSSPGFQNEQDAVPGSFPEDVRDISDDSNTEQPIESQSQLNSGTVLDNETKQPDIRPMVPFEMSNIMFQQTEPVAPLQSNTLDTVNLRPHVASARDSLIPSYYEENLAVPTTPISAVSQGLDGVGAFAVSDAFDELTLPPQEYQFGDSTSKSLEPGSEAQPILDLTNSLELKSEGTQTMVSSDEIDNLIKEKDRRSAAAAAAATSLTPSPLKSPTSSRTMSMGSKTSDQLASSDASRSPRRAGSLGNLTRSAGNAPIDEPPPLPADHKQVIAAIAKSTPPVPSMPPPPPPVAIATASRALSPQGRMQTPTGSVTQSPVVSRYPSAAAAATRDRTQSMAGRSEATRRSSVSTFASEVDDTFNRPYPPIGYEFDMGSDPRMIQAITQTMIGEFMYKYTRKAGRGDHSGNRHRRFFWIHPYTRTLYWSTQDPARAAKAELKAKSVPIEAVRVVIDNNANPPGLHYKSIIIVTPSRDIKLTAPTSHRHETWFSALSYLLVRNNANDRESDLARQVRPISDSNNHASVASRGSMAERPRTAVSVTAEDIAEFNPTLGSNRTSSSRIPPGYSYRQYTDQSPRPTSAARSSVRAASVQAWGSPSRQGQQQYLSSRGTPSSAAGQRVSTEHELQTTPTPVRNTVDLDGFKKPLQPTSANKITKSVGGSEPPSPNPTGKARRMSGLSSRFSSLGRSRSVVTLNRQSSSAIQTQNANELDESASSGLKRSGSAIENVRACCDGKHNVGTLSQTCSHSLSRRHSRTGSRVSLRDTLSMSSRH